MRQAFLAEIALAGCALVGLPALAQAQGSPTHLLSVQLPGGGVEQIAYTGDTPPAVVMVPSIISEPPFALFDRIAAEMDQQMATLMRAAETMAAQPIPGSGPLTEAAFGTLPPGASGYSVVSTLSGDGVCTRTVQITSTGDGAPPRVIQHVSGACGAAPHGAVPAELPSAPAPARPAHTIMVRAQAPARPDKLLQVAWQN